MAAVRHLRPPGEARPGLELGERDGDGDSRDGFSAEQGDENGTEEETGRMGQREGYGRGPRGEGQEYEQGEDKPDVDYIKGRRQEAKDTDGPDSCSSATHSWEFHLEDGTDDN